MIWQDLVVSIANIMFGYSLIYQVYVGFKEKKSAIAVLTSSLTTIGMYALVVVYFSLNMYTSAIVSIFNGTMWLLLFIQGIMYGKKERSRAEKKK